MNLISLAIPEDASQLHEWLEKHLVGLELGALVAELSAVHSGQTPAATLEDVLGTRIGQVLSQGLRGLPPQNLKRFLTQPQLLLELQEMILMSGGAYWDQIAQRSSAVQLKMERGQRRLRTMLMPATRLAGEERNILKFENRDARPWLRRRWLAGLAAAAMVMIAILLNMYGPRPEKGAPPEIAQAAWGWNKPDAFPENIPAKQYLAALADTANEWFKKRPESAADIAKRIGEFRQGCSALLFAEHRALAAVDRQWLLERCRAWADKLDQHLKAVEGGADPVKVRGEADETVKKLINAIETRAKELRA